MIKKKKKVEESERQLSRLECCAQGRPAFSPATTEHMVPQHHQEWPLHRGHCPLLCGHTDKKKKKTQINVVVVQGQILVASTRDIFALLGPHPGPHQLVFSCHMPMSFTRLGRLWGTWDSVVMRVA